MCGSDSLPLPAKLRSIHWWHRVIFDAQFLGWVWWRFGFRDIEVCLVAIMSDEAKEPLSKSDLLRNSFFYRVFQAQREEVLKHKWIKSEKAGHDIGFEQALTDWIIKHHSSWLKRR